LVPGGDAGHHAEQRGEDYRAPDRDAGEAGRLRVGADGGDLKTEGGFFHYQPDDNDSGEGDENTGVQPRIRQQLRQLCAFRDRG